MDGALVNEKGVDYTSCEGVLRPITTFGTGRYEKSSFATSDSMMLPPGYPYISSSIPQYLPQQWTAYTHPEGQLYFHRDAPLKITTDAYLYSPGTLNKVLYWSKRIENLLEEKGIPLSDMIELFVLIEDSGCAYYFIDHNSRSQFWLEPLRNEDLDIPDVDSPSHLNIYLEQLYWGHVENFPFAGLPVKVVDDLLCVLSHALTDHITSSTSTFFYSQKECTQFIEVLKLAREHSTDPHQVCVIARLWKQVCNHRFQVHYGQETCRLSRDQAIIYDPPTRSRLSTAARYLTFYASDVYLAKLTDLFVDHLVYFSEWQPFIGRTLKSWRRTFWAALAMILLHGLFFFAPSSPYLAAVSAFLSCASLLTSAILVHRYDRLDEACANDAYEHLEAIHSETYDFQLVAFTYALPSALQFWAFGVLMLNAMVIFEHTFGLRWAIGCGSSAVVMLACFLRITSEFHFSCPSVSRIWKREKAEKDEKDMV